VAAFGGLENHAKPLWLDGAQRSQIERLGSHFQSLGHSARLTQKVSVYLLPSH